MSFLTPVLYLVAALLRAFLFLQGWDSVLQRRIEVSTPANSFRGGEFTPIYTRMFWKECIYYNTIYVHTMGITAIFFVSSERVLLMQYHILLIAQYFIENLYLIKLLYLVCDLLTAYMLGAAARQCTKYLAVYYASACAKGVLYRKDNPSVLAASEPRVQALFESSLPRTQLAGTVQQAVTLCYLFNPFAIVSCIALSTTSLDNTLIVAALYSAAVLQGHFGFMLSIVLLVLGAANSIHLSALALASAVFYHTQTQTNTIPKGRKSDGRGQQPQEQWTSVLVYIGCTVALFTVLLTAFMYTLYVLYGDTQFLTATYGFVLSVPNLQPNLGLFWYFFIEVFDHFRVFFTWVFQVNILVYLLPMAITLRHEPLTLYVCLLVLISVFKPYPSVADTAVYLSLLPAFTHLFKFLPHTLTTGCAFVVSLLLCPIMWTLWIDVGSANANFFFACTLFYNTAQIFLLTDLLFAHHSVLTACHYGLRPVYVTQQKEEEEKEDKNDEKKPVPSSDKGSIYTEYRLMFSNHMFSWLK